MRRLLGVVTAAALLLPLSGALAAPTGPFAESAERFDILWADFCERKPAHAKCAGPAPTVAPTVVPTVAPTATAAPTPTPAPTTAPTPTPPPPPTAANILGVDFASLPTSGPAWSAVQAAANESIGSPSLADQDDPDNVRTLAAGLVYARTGALRSKVITALRAIRNTDSGRNLALARELPAYVIAADLVKPTDVELGYSFRGFLRDVLAKVRVDDAGSRTLEVMAQEQGNNWGTHGQAALAASYAYLGDKAGLERTANVTRGFLGDLSAWQGWDYHQSTSWATTKAPINPKGAAIGGHSVDGVIQQDQARAGSFGWPPPCENYTWEALQGLTLAAELLRVQGYGSWDWSDRSILRAVTWLHSQASCPASGDDVWVPTLVNARYGTTFPDTSGRGKNFGFTDWLF